MALKKEDFSSAKCPKCKVGNVVVSSHMAVDVNTSLLIKKTEERMYWDYDPYNGSVTVQCRCENCGANLSLEEVLDHNDMVD